MFGNIEIIKLLFTSKDLDVNIPMIFFFNFFFYKISNFFKISSNSINLNFKLFFKILTYWHTEVFINKKLNKVKKFSSLIQFS